MIYAFIVFYLLQGFLNAYLVTELLELDKRMKDIEEHLFDV